MNRTFAPSGITDDKQIRTASSITDYIFRRLGHDYLSFDDKIELGLASIDDVPPQSQTLPLEDPAPKMQSKEVPEPANMASDVTSVTDSPESTKKHKGLAQNSAAPLCYSCGNQTQRSGSCYVCTACGSTTGCS